MTPPIAKSGWALSYVRATWHRHVLADLRRAEVTEDLAERAAAMRDAGIRLEVMARALREGADAIRAYPERVYPS
jgi:hypothetical protein